MTKKYRGFIVGNLAIYLLILVWVILFHATFETLHRAFDPDFRTINFYVYLNGRESILNMLIFVPLGLYLGALFDKQPFIGKMGMVIAVSLLFEIAQYIFAIGTTDVMDLINNGIGGGAGLTICVGVKALLKERFHKAALASSALCTLLMMAIVLFVPLR